MRSPSSVVVLIATALLFLCSNAQAQYPAQIHYIDVGYSDAILLEFNKAAVLIDAGGSRVYEGGSPYRLVNYLTAFFNRRRDLNFTIDLIIISESKHTLSLPDVVRKFRVKRLIDNGQSNPQLSSARTWIHEHGGRYYRIDGRIARTFDYSNAALQAIEDLEPNLRFELMTTYGEPRCQTPSNSSIIVAMVYNEKRFLFAGDTDLEAPRLSYGCLSDLRQRKDYLYGHPELLQTEVYKVEGHGSSVTSRPWRESVDPKIAIISTSGEAGRVVEGRRVSAYPLESEVRLLEAIPTLESRPGRFVPTVDRDYESRMRELKKAVYCTCWDGDIVIDAKTLNVQTSPERSAENRTLISSQPINLPSPLPAYQDLVSFDALPVERQKQTLSTHGPLLPNSYEMSNIQMRGFLKGGWPFFIYYSLRKGAAALTISTDDAEPFRKELAPGVEQHLVVTVPQRFGNELSVAKISLASDDSTDEEDEPPAFEVHAMGILEAQPTRANHHGLRIPPTDLPISVIPKDKRTIVTSKNETVQYGFYSRLPYSAGAADFFRFKFDFIKGVIAERVYGTRYNNIRAGHETEQRGWDGRDWHRAYSFGTHRLQIRTWHAQKKGGIWFGPYFGPQLDVLK